MKKTLSIISLCFIILIAFGQTIKITEPEFSGVILMVQNDSTGVPLEKQKSYVATKGMSFAGIGKGSVVNLVNGTTSPVRTKSKTKLTFIVKVKDNSIDPTQIINLFKLEKNSDNRYVVVQKSKAQGWVGASAGATTMDINFLSFTAKKYGTSSYIITVDPSIEPGEYAMTIEGSRFMFNLFGVD